MTEYTKNMELAMYLPNVLIEALLLRSPNLSVYISNKAILGFAKGISLAVTNRAVRTKCT
jgi:hypothetical protein